MFRTTLAAAPLSLILLSLGCDAAEPQSAPAGAATKHQGMRASTTPVVAGAPKEEPTPPDPQAVEPESEEPAANGVPPQALGGAGEPMPFATDAVVKAAVEIAGKAKPDWIPSKVLEGPDAALAVLHLAQTAEDPHLAGAALKALPGLYWAGKHDERRIVDADYVAVVVRRLASNDPHILEGALSAADLAAGAEPPDPTLLAALLERANPGQPPEARIMALRGLAGVKPLTGDVQKVFLTALKDEDLGMVALTLSSMNMYTNRFTDRGPLVAQLREMTSSEHAGVRGKALAALTNVDRSTTHRDATTKLALEMLDDEEPLVRGEAVYALGVMRRVEHADKVLGLMDDEAAVKVRIDGWSKLDGSSADKTLLAPGGQTVTGTALLSLAIISSATDSKFEYVKLIDRKTRGRPNHAAAVVAAKAWVEAHGSE